MSTWSNGAGRLRAEAAAQYYFHKSAGALNLEEAVRLAAALPDPLGWSPRRDPCEPAGRPHGVALALRGEAHKPPGSVNLSGRISQI